MKASDAKQFIGKMVRYRKLGWPGWRVDVVEGTQGKNIICQCDALWGPDIEIMELMEEPPTLPSCAN